MLEEVAEVVFELGAESVVERFGTLLLRLVGALAVASGVAGYVLDLFATLVAAALVCGGVVALLLPTLFDRVLG